MIGTAHISEESANLVRRTIKTVKPDVVMIELDPKRIGRVSGSNQTLEQAGIERDSSVELSAVTETYTGCQLFLMQSIHSQIKRRTLSFSISISYSMY